MTVMVWGDDVDRIMQDREGAVGDGLTGEEAAAVFPPGRSRA